MEKVIKKLFFVWGMDKEKAFLEAQAKQGWILKKVGFGRYTFYKDEPKDLVYEFDFHILTNKEQLEDYLSYFEGWTHVDTFGSWYYFYKLRDESSTNSIFNDLDSRKKMLRRLVLFLIIIALPLYYNLLILMPTKSFADFEFPKFWFFMRIIIIAIFLLHTYAGVRIMFMIHKLNKEISQ